jgi:hypothetical protein
MIITQRVPLPPPYSHFVISFHKLKKDGLKIKLYIGNDVPIVLPLLDAVPQGKETMTATDPYELAKYLHLVASQIQATADDLHDRGDL